MKKIMKFLFVGMVFAGFLSLPSVLGELEKKRENKKLAIQNKQR
jgi:hypothetical protein